MLPIFSISLFIGAVASAKSSDCIFAHTYRQSCRPDGEHMYFEAYAQTGDICCRQVCLGVIRRTFEHGGAWKFDHNNGCERGFTMEVNENGTSVRLEGSDGLLADLIPRKNSESASKSRALVCSENSLGYHYESCLYSGSSGPECDYCPWCNLEKGCLGYLGLPAW
ncbi:hypothetical protein B0T16DRAFT_406219 [Cercophora newfieldiana]|uniref:Secreted protein n=1 Tax=Cercophora newfieldiana TaxID=92897 RepID=A0AA40CX69_9PEZI|nr:hypothetical protein B0T16DRAFT_406219 [Cercophora newfieldiana]